MPRAKNNITLIGRLTENPTLKKTSDGKSVLNFTLAVKNTAELTDWIPCVAWGTCADTIGTYCDKGQKMACHGELHSRTREYQGKKWTAIEVTVDTIEFMGGSGRPAEPELVRESEGPFISSDELPF